ncbi:MAG: hypothetical protein KAH13_05765 [Tenericutes bacterium]|nr:hypothetical protein [Mycoplasmatota bacterium]
MKNKKMKSILILIAIPLIISVMLYLITKNPLIVEVTFVVFGLIELIVFVSRLTKNDKINMKKTGTYKHNKSSVGYHNYKYKQSIVLLSAFANFALSYLTFLVLGV